MGILSRLNRIVRANINSLLDQAEDPEKMVRLLIKDMEETLVEVKAAAANLLAAQKRNQRQIDEARQKMEYWQEQARTAVSRQRDDLAREALLERRRLADRMEALERDMAAHEDLLKDYREDIDELDGKLSKARNKYHELLEKRLQQERLNRARAMADAKAREGERPAGGALREWEAYNRRMERLEAEAEIAGHSKKLEEEFERLVFNEDIEKELDELKKEREQ